MNKDEIKAKISILVSNLLSQNPDMSEFDIQVAIYEKGMSEPCESCPYYDKNSKLYYEGVERGMWMQNGIIDRIREEIKNDIHKCNNTDMAFGMQHTLDVIDKYRTGSNEIQTNEIVYDVGGHMYGTMGGDVIMDILAGKRKK